MSVQVKIDDFSTLCTTRKAFIAKIVHQTYEQIVARNERNNEEKTKSEEKLNSKSLKTLSFVIRQIIEKHYLAPWNVVCGYDMGYSIKFKKDSLGIFEIYNKNINEECVQTTENIRGENVDNDENTGNKENKTNDISNKSKKIKLKIIAYKSPRVCIDEENVNILNNEEKELNNLDETKISKLGLRINGANDDENIVVENEIKKYITKLQNNKNIDTEYLSNLIRTKLSTRFGSLWHIIIGTNFSISTIQDDQISSSFLYKYDKNNQNNENNHDENNQNDEKNDDKKDTEKYELVCFKHIDQTSTFLPVVARHSPAILAFIYCTYAITRSIVCEAPHPNIPEMFCESSKSEFLTYAFLVLFFIATGMRNAYKEKY